MITRNLLITLLLLIMFSAMAPGEGSAETDDLEDVLSTVPAQWRADVENVINLAVPDWNDGQLIEALSTWPVGTAKHRAVCFLISHMDKHLYVDYVNPDDPLNPFSPEDGGAEWAREYIWDYSTVTSEFIIENVEWAFLARESFSWCRELSEELFFAYVLPYRSTQEPLHSWRPLMFETYAPIVSGVDNSLDAAWVVNSYNTRIFGFDPLYYRHPEDRDIPTLMACGLGRCEDMSNLSNYSLRAVGVPTTSDFTPRWPKGDNNHAWNVVYFEGRWYQFMGCEAGSEPVWDSIKSRPFAKVYRKSFSADPIMGYSPDGTAPPRLMRVAAIDVTEEYTTVSDIDIRVENPAGATFLCVYNYGDWRAVAGAWMEGDTVNFPNAGNEDILYCATRYIEDETGWGSHIPVATPFVLHLDGSVEHMSPCPAAMETGDIVLNGWTSSPGLEEGQEVTLFQYVGNPMAFETNPEDTDEIISPMAWEMIGTQVAYNSDESSVVTFPGAAVEGGLFILSDNQDPGEFREGSRPFVWTSEGIIYY